MNKIGLYIFLGLFLISFSAFGQENVRVQGSVSDNTIRLRWAPANSQAWLEGKKYGYVLEKITAFRNGEFIETPWEKESRVILQAPLKDWEALLHSSDYAAVMAQAFYGERFQVDMTGTYEDIINQANELEQRFATSIFAAGYDYQASVLAGWAWTDTGAKENERYLYRIYLNKPEPEAGDTAVIVLGLSDKRNLPKPIELNALFGDKKVILAWNYLYQEDYYHSYHIERSIDGGAFEQITDLPVTLMSEDKQVMFYTDSLPDNSLTCTYRIRGLTSFDEMGPYSDEVSGKGKETVTCVPAILSGDFSAKDQAWLLWTIDCEHPEQLQKLEIKRAGGIDGEYTSVMDNIPPSQREAVISLPDRINYLQVYAYNEAGEAKSSFPFLLQQVDSIPPAIPTGLKVSIDSMAVAHLSWDPNKEEDLRGYRILRAFTKEEEKSSITPVLLTVNEYTDTLSLQLGNEAVYYAVSALDTYYNESQACETVKALKPNNSTPADPVITAYETDENKVRISWITDAKDPSVVYRLIRSEISGEEPVQKILVSGDYKRSEYTDEIDASGTYTYQVVAEGAGPNKTSVSQKVTLTIQVKEKQNAVSGFTYYKDEKANYIELSWSKHPKAALYRLYKAEEDKPLTLFKELDAIQNKLVDEQVSPGTKYTYCILYLTGTNQPSASKSIIINF